MPGRGSLLNRLRAGLHAARATPAFVLYLGALATFGFKWLSPISSLHERAIWSDLLLAASAGLWLWERLRNGRLPAIRSFHVALGLYLAAAAVSMAFAADGGTAATNVLLMLELAVLAVLTSEFASDPERRNAIVVAVVFVCFYTSVLAAVGLILFYVGVDTSLLGSYGEQFIPSDRYARVTAGFQSPPLLASFCIFASAVVARDDTTLSPRLRRATQVALGALVLLTFSRGILGFAAVSGIRSALAPRRSRVARIAGVSVVVASIALIAGLTLGRLEVEPTRPATVTYEVPDPGNRREALVTSLDTLGDHPLVGEGPGSLPGENRGVPFRAHMTPLNIAATMGLPALAAAAFLVISLWRNRRRPTPIATWSGMAGLGVDALAQDAEHFRHVWVMIGWADADRRRRS